MKALLDEQLSPQIAARLRDRGHDVEAVAGRTDLVGSTDREALELAVQEGRAVVTNNVKDFRPLAAQWLAQGRIHAGLILVTPTRTRTRAAVPALARAIEQVLRDHPDGLASAERWIEPLASP